MKTKLLLFLVIFQINKITFAQTASASKAFTLADAVAYALQNSFKAKVSETEIERAKKKIWETTAIGLPQVSASAQVNDFIDIPVQVVPGEFFGAPAGTFIDVRFGTKYTSSASIQASQLLFDGSYLVGLQASRAYKNLVQLQDAQTDIDIKKSVSQAYVNVLVATESYNKMNEIAKNLEKLFAETKAYFDAGFTEETDVDQFQITLQNITNTRDVLAQQINLAKMVLAINMGLPVSETVECVDNLNAIIASNGLENANASGFNANQHIDMKVVNQSKNLLFLDYRNKQSSMLPTLSAFFSHGQNAFRQTFNIFDFSQRWFPSTVVGVQLNLPILSSGNRLAAAQVAKLEYKKVEFQQKEFEQALTLQAKQAEIELNSNKMNYQTALKNAEIAKKIYDRNTVKYKEGLISSLDLTQAQNQYFQAESAYFQAVSNYLNAAINFKKATGAL
jgi:outer membrane protein TolC